MFCLLVASVGWVVVRQMSVFKCWRLVVGCRCRWLLLVLVVECRLLIVSVGCCSLFSLSVPSSVFLGAFKHI
jgi:hypothetical protein